MGFAHELLAKHEANMRQREAEGLYSATPDSDKQSNNYQMIGEGKVTIFSGGANEYTPRG